MEFLEKLPTSRHTRIGPYGSASLSRKFRGNTYPRVAVYQREVGSRGRGHASVDRTVEDGFLQALIGKGYTVVARSDLDEILSEQRIQASDVTEAALARAGRVLNVDAILLVDVSWADATRYGLELFNGESSSWMAEASLSARLIGVELAELLWIGSWHASVRTPGRDGATAVLHEISRVAARSIPAR